METSNTSAILIATSMVGLASPRSYPGKACVVYVKLLIVLQTSWCIKNECYVVMLRIYISFGV